MKTIIFDFDGTLTKKDQNIWKMIWQYLGYPVDKTSLYAKLYVDCIIKKSITRKEWFDKTCDAFCAHNLNKDDLKSINETIEPIDGLGETISYLHDQGYKLVVLSGCLVSTIKEVLGEFAPYFSIIESNNATFNNFGELVSLDPTPYDYEGKYHFINKYMQLTQTSADDIIFIGNSDNDEYVSQTGCKTICINPTHLADSSNSNKWHVVIDNVSNLKQILPELKFDVQHLENSKCC